MYVPSVRLRCVMHVRKGLGCNPKVSTLFCDCVLRLTLTINTRPPDFVNVYFSHAAAMFSFLPTYSPPPNFNISVDFNSTPNALYGPAMNDYPI